MFWNLVIIIGIFWCIMSLFSFIQTIQINNNFKELKNHGEVYFGRDAGFLRTRIIVFAAVDEYGKVVDARRMRTYKFFIPAKTSAFSELIGKDLNKLIPSEIFEEKRLKMAIEDLLQKYKTR